MAILTDKKTAFTRLAGTAEADVFRFIADGNVDAITNFTDGSDRIDLSLFAGLTFAGLTIRDGVAGRVTIEWMDTVNNRMEKINLTSGDASVRAADLTAADFIFSTGPAQQPPPPQNFVRDNGKAFSQLQGTAAADSFVFLKDGRQDAILGFEDGRDVIDLSAIAGLGFDDLTIRTGTQGRVIIEYANGDVTAENLPVIERIVLRNNAEGFLAEDLTAADFIFA